MVIRPEAARPPAVVIRLEVELRPVLVIRLEACPPVAVIRLEAARPVVAIRPVAIHQEAAVAIRSAVAIRLEAVRPLAVGTRLGVIPQAMGGRHKVGRQVTPVHPRTAVPRRAALRGTVHHQAVPAFHQAGRATRERRLLERSPMP